MLITACRHHGLIFPWGPVNSSVLDVDCVSHHAALYAWGLDFLQAFDVIALTHGGTNTIHVLEVSEDSKTLR